MANLKTRQPRHWRKALLVWAAAQALAGAAQAGEVVYRATYIPFLAGGVSGEAFALNNAGDVVGSMRDASGDYQAFLYHGGQTFSLGAHVSGQDASATAITDPVGVVGRFTVAGSLCRVCSGGQQLGFVQSFNNLTGLAAPTTFSLPGGVATQVTGINQSGMAVGYGVNDHNAFVRYAAGQIGVLPTLIPGGGAKALAVNNAGQVVGSVADSPSNWHTALWENGQLRVLPGLSGRVASATAISQNGLIVGMAYDADTDENHAFMFRNGAWSRVAGNLDRGADWAFSHATGVNSAGQVIGKYRSGYFSDDAVFLAPQGGDAVDLRAHIVGLSSISAITEVNAINEIGQIAARTRGENAVLLSPEGTLSWAKLRGGSVAEPGNWDSGLGFAPNRLLDVVIDSRPTQTVLGDLSFDAKSLQIGGDQGGSVTLQLSGGVSVRPLQGLTILSNGILQGQGRVTGPAVINHGRVQALPGQLLQLDGGLDNRGLVTGSGRIETNLVNRGGGAIGVRVEAGQDLTLAGTGHSAANGSVMRVSDGGALSFEGRLVHEGGATLQIDSATLRVVQGMDNAGQVLVGSGRAEILGDVNNGPRGLVHAQDGADLTVWDSLRNDGEVRVSGGSLIVYAGAVSGKGSFTGTEGMHRFQGGYGPGNSAAEVSMGNVQFASLVTMELGGLLAGSRHDRINFTGSAAFEETSFLSITLISNFVPHAGDTFALFSYAQAPVGNFEDFFLPTLSGGLSWDVSRIHTSGVLAVTSVPEPSAAALWLAGLAGMWTVARRRTRRG